MWESRTATFRKGFQSLAAVCYYMLWCPVTSPGRTAEFLRNVYRFRAADRLLRLDSSTIPTVCPDSLFPSLFEHQAHLLELGGKHPTGTTLFESYLLASLVQSLQPRILFEFGTFEGATTLQLALNSPEDAQIYTLDLPEDFTTTRYPLTFRQERLTQRLPVGDIFFRRPVARKITQLYGDSATIDLGRFRGKVDLIFVDGDHGNDYVRSDSERAFSMRSPNGVIVWHDYGSKWEAVTTCLRDIVGQQDKRIYHLQGTNLAVYAPQAGLLQPQLRS